LYNLERCEHVNVQVIVQRGNLRTTEGPRYGYRGSSRGTDGCGPYYERQATGRVTPGIAVGMRLEFFLHRTKIFSHFRGRQTRAYDRC
jgi:hypothetical protein